MKYKIELVVRSFPFVEIGILSYCRSTVLLWRGFFFKYPPAAEYEIHSSFVFVLVGWILFGFIITTYKYSHASVSMKKKIEIVWTYFDGEEDYQSRNREEKHCVYSYIQTEQTLLPQVLCFFSPSSRSSGLLFLEDHRTTKPSDPSPRLILKGVFGGTTPPTRSKSCCAFVGFFSPFMATSQLP